MLNPEVSHLVPHTTLRSHWGADRWLEIRAPSKRMFNFGMRSDDQLCPYFLKAEDRDRDGRNLLCKAFTKKNSEAK